MNHSVRKRLSAFLALGAFLLGAPVAQAQKYQPEDPVPAGASGKVLPLSGKVLGIQGLATGVAGKAQSVTAALKDLGAKVSDREIKIELSADVLFDFDKYDLRPDAFDSLRKVGAVLKEYLQAPVLIAGHTDAKGVHAYNQKLSTNRAVVIKQWLVEHAGIEAGRLATQGLAETKPVAPNTKSDGSDDPEGRQKNRRVEIIVEKHAK